MALSWIKLLLAVLIIAFCTLLGYLAGNDCRARSQYFTQFCRLNELYLSELRFMRKPLADFLQGFPAQGEFLQTIQGFLGSHKAKCDYRFLRKEEQTLVMNYFDMMGRGDSASQTQYFQTQQEELTRLDRQYQGERKSRCVLYMKLGLLAGLAFVILII